jgi:hypothetical protein
VETLISLIEKESADGEKKREAETTAGDEGTQKKAKAEAEATNDE